MHLRRQVAQTAPRQHVVFPDGPRIVHKDDVHLGFHAPVLEAVVQQDEIDFGMFPADACDSFGPLLAHGDDCGRMVPFDLLGFVAHIEEGGIHPHFHISFRPAAVAARKHRNGVVAPQPLDEVFRDGCFSRTSDRDVPHADHGDVRTVPFDDARIVKQMPYPQCECVQTGRYGTKETHRRRKRFYEQLMRIFKVRPKARKNKVFRCHSRKIDISAARNGFSGGRRKEAKTGKNENPGLRAPDKQDDGTPVPTFISRACWWPYREKPPAERSASPLRTPSRRTK